MWWSAWGIRTEKQSEKIKRKSCQQPFDVNDVPKYLQIKTKTKATSKKKSRSRAKKKISIEVKQQKPRARMRWQRYSRKHCAKQRVNWHVSKIIIAPIISTLLQRTRYRKQQNTTDAKIHSFRATKNRKRPYREIIMIDRLQSKRVVNEYLERPVPENEQETERSTAFVPREFEAKIMNISKS